MATGYSYQSRFAWALQEQQDQGRYFCPYPNHGGRVFQDFQQFLDHAKIDHLSDFEGLDTRQSRAKLRELSKRFRSNNSSVATVGDRSASDIGGPTFDSEKKPLRTSPTSGRKRSAPTAHEFTGYKGQALSHAEVADPDYSRYTPSLYLTTPEPSSGWSTDATKSSKLASSQPQSSDRQPQRTIPKPQPSQRESSILHPPHTNPRYPSLILQPDRRPISQEELASEAKSIYAGLTMIEAKCMHVDRARAAAIAEEGEARTNLASDHWQALIALHRTLLHEHHDFFLASQHPSSSPELRRLAAKYSMPARMWMHGIYSFLKLLQKHLPESIDHMLAFIYLAYQMVALLYETVPAFEDTWIECLGDLGRFRMAIEDEDVRDRETWAGVARSWYIKAADKNPTVGRLYHHLAILARPHMLLQMYYYSRSLASVKPFQNARESIKALLDPLVQESQHTALDDFSNDKVFVLAHASQFNYSSIEKDSFGINKPTAKFSAPKAKFLEKLDKYVGRVTAKWKDQGVYVAVANIAGWFDYGVDKNLIRHAFLQQLYPPPPPESSNENDVNARDNQKNASPSDQQEPEKEKDDEDKIPLTPEEWEKAQERIENNRHLNNARLLTYETSALVFRRLGDKNVLPHVHVMLAFLFNVASSKHVSFLIADAPWAELVAFLNTLIKTKIRHSQSKNEKQGIVTLLATDVFPREGERDDELPLPEDYHIRGQIWAQHFPEKWFEREHDEEERYLELESTGRNREERVLRLGYRIAKLKRWISYNKASHYFEPLALVSMKTEASH
ncbi:EST1-DNA-bind domain containing protein [Pyrenophora tritici-repentis]|nr:EST1-DNA-bind domain containing protein [Pyrenophora tritici-repentis]